MAESETDARDAAALVHVQYEDLPAILTIEQAIRERAFIEPTHELKQGDPDAAFAACDRVIEGQIKMGGQEHFYFETNAALCVPGEKGEMMIYSSTQNPNLTQVRVRAHASARTVAT